jgi:hypothetical protein
MMNDEWMVIAACAEWRLLEQRASCTAHLPTPHLRRLSGYQSWSLLPAHTTVALALLPVNCPDLRYPRSGIIMAFLAHLHTCTWIAWINSREVDQQGHPTRFDTSHPGPLMRPRIMEPRDTESNSCALLGSDKRERGTSGQRMRAEQSLVVRLQCCHFQRHDVVVNFLCTQLPRSFGWLCSLKSTVGSPWG